jgi:hypothetical protein
MTDTTLTDLTFLENEEQTRAYIHLVTPLIQKAVRDAAGDFASHEEVSQVGNRVGEVVAEQLLRRVSERFDELTDAQELWQKEFERKNEERLATLATKEELSGVTLSGAENTTKIIAMEAAHDERLKALEKESKEFKNTDAQRVKEIGDIKASAAKTADNAEKTSQAVIRLIDQYKTRNEDVDRELHVLKITQAKNVEDLLRVESEMRTIDMIGRDIEGRVMQSMTAIDKALFGDPQKNISGVIADVKTVRDDMWWILWTGRHPRVLLTIIGAAYVLFLIVTAFILGRPEIVAQFIPGAASTRP